MAEMQVGRARVDAKFHAKGTAERELLFELRLTDDLRGALFEGGESFVRLHDGIVQQRRAGCYLFLLSNSRTSSMVMGWLCWLSAF